MFLDLPLADPRHPFHVLHMEMALEEAGLLVESLRKTKTPERAVVSEASRRWQRIPLFLHVRARRP